MSAWNKLTIEKVTRAHRSSVLDSASELLKSNAEQAVPAQRSLIWGSLGLSFGAIVAVVTAYRARRGQPEIEDGEMLAVAQFDPDLLLEIEILEELELLENLENLEQWEET